MDQATDPFFCVAVRERAQKSDPSLCRSVWVCLISVCVLLWDCQDFMRYCDPPSSVGEALRKFRDFLIKAQQTQGTLTEDDTRDSKKIIVEQKGSETVLELRRPIYPAVSFTTVLSPFPDAPSSLCLLCECVRPGRACRAGPPIAEWRQGAGAERHRPRGLPSGA